MGVSHPQTTWMSRLRRMLSDEELYCWFGASCGGCISFHVHVMFWCGCGWCMHRTCLLLLCLHFHTTTVVFVFCELVRSCLVRPTMLQRVVAHYPHRPVDGVVGVVGTTHMWVTMRNVCDLNAGVAFYCILLVDKVTIFVA